LPPLRSTLLNGRGVFSFVRFATEFELLRHGDCDLTKKKKTRVKPLSAVRVPELTDIIYRWSR
jgi:hypothetical protein